MTRSIRLKPRLKEGREAKGLSQAALGRLIGSHQLPGFRPNHVGLFELGYRDATWAEVVALASALKVEAHWLAGQEVPAPAAVGSGVAKAQEPASTNGTPAAAGLAVAAKPPATSSPATPTARLPPDGVPARQGATEALYRQQLGERLAEANRLLNDRSLAPAEWRAWRQHAEQIKAALRAL